MRILGEGLKLFAKILIRLIFISMIYFLLRGGIWHLCHPMGVFEMTTAEIVEVVNNETSYDNPASEYGSNFYRIKYWVNGGYIAPREPVELDTLFEVGDSYKISVIVPNGDINIHWDDNNVIYSLIVCLSFGFTIQYILYLFVLAIDILLKEKWKGLLKTMFKFIAGAIGVFLLWMGINLSFIGNSDILGFFNGSYEWVEAHPVNCEYSYTNDNNEDIYKCILRQEIKGKWIEFEDNIVIEDNIETVDSVGYLMNISNGDFVDDYIEDIKTYSKHTIIGLILLILSKIEFKKKNKTLFLEDCLEVKSEIVNDNIRTELNEENNDNNIEEKENE